MIDIELVAGCNIIVVDDKSENLQLVRASLQHTPLTLRLFMRAAQALESARLMKPDLFLLDIDMPEMDGYELCAAIQQDQLLKDIPVVFLSCFSTAFDKVKGLQSGGVDYISKPFYQQELEARLITHLSRYKYQQSLNQKNLELNEALEQNLKMQEQVVLHERFAAVTELIMGLAHEINTPLGIAVTGLTDAIDKTQMLQQHHQAKTISSSQLETGLNNIIEGQKIVESNLAKSIDLITELRVLSEHNDPVYTEISLQEIINTVLADIRTKYSQREICLSLDMDEGLSFRLSKSIMAEILLALMDNTLCHGTTSGPADIFIEAGVSTEGNELRLSYHDNGVSPSKEDFETLFSPFSTSRRNEGKKGLGLHLVCQLTNRLSGKCSANVADNGSLELRLTFPLADISES